MKKIVLPALLALASVASSLVANAQTACPASVPAANIITVGNGPGKTLAQGATAITANTTWTRNNIYLLNGTVFVNDGVTLTIESGTIIKGDRTNQGTLVIKQGGRLVAIGTPTQPIVFTSNQPAGSRSPGDWGGVVICGRAPVNQPSTPFIEGGLTDTFYGGTNPADNSGTMQYVRIEYPGVPFLPNSEINGLTLAGVGHGTTLDHIQVTASGDDSFEWFGGTVNAKYLIALTGTDDDFDTDNGYSGRVQFGFALRNPALGDTQSGAASNGLESDNDAAGSANNPRTLGVFSNMTVLLPVVASPATAYVSSRSIEFKRNTSISVFNSVFSGRRFGVEFGSNSSNQTPANAVSGSLVLANNVFASAGPLPFRAGRVTSNQATPVANFNVNTFVGTGNDTTTTVSGLGLNADNFSFEGNCPTNRACAPALNLPAASLLNTGAAFTNAKLTGAGNGGANSTFDVVNYRGAFGATNWATGWVNFNPQITCYNVPGQTLAKRDAVDAPLQALSVSPNPTEGAAAILNFDVKTATTATVRVLDLMGREVALVLNAGRLSAGPQALSLPATMAPGVYVATVATAQSVQSVRFVVTK